MEDYWRPEGRALRWRVTRASRTEGQVLQSSEDRDGLHAYLTLHSHRHQGWLTQGKSPQQQVRGGGCPHFPWRTVGYHEFAEVEFVGKPLAFGLVKDPFIVVIPRELRVGPVRKEETRSLLMSLAVTGGPRQSSHRESISQALQEWEAAGSARNHSPFP